MTEREQGIPVEAGEALDALIAEKVMGQCAHEVRHVTVEEMVPRERAKILAQWEADYGSRPPEKYLDEAATGAARWAEESDYPPKVCSKCGSEGPFGRGYHPPRYSTDIAAAWEVVAVMRERHDRLLRLEQYLMNSDEYEDWQATFVHRATDVEWCNDSIRFDAGQPAPLAICLAALKAVAHLSGKPSVGEPVR